MLIHAFNITTDSGFCMLCLINEFAAKKQTVIYDNKRRGGFLWSIKPSEVADVDSYYNLRLTGRALGKPVASSCHSAVKNKNVRTSRGENHK